MNDTYYVLASENRCEIKIKGSRFIASGKEISSRAEAEEFIRLISKEFYDATHNCFAYRTGFGSERDIEFRWSDDGEPSGTAGAPIYKVIEGEGLTNTVIVVTRYYGGTKLGTGGLIRAYSDAAKLLTEETGKAERILYTFVSLEYDYGLTSQVMHVINNFSGKIENSEYGNTAISQVKIRPSEKEKFIEELELITNAQVKIL